MFDFDTIIKSLQENAMFFNSLYSKHIKCYRSI